MDDDSLTQGGYRWENAVLYHTTHIAVHRHTPLMTTPTLTHAHIYTPTPTHL